MLMRLTAKGVIITAIFVFMANVQAGQIPIMNNSFEIPPIGPNDFPAIPIVPLWIEKDLDSEYSQNTGVFRNPEPNSPYGDYIVNADGSQLAFLGSQTGNGFLQNLTEATYQAGKRYKLMVEVCPSVRYHPSAPDPANHLAISLYYLADANEIDIQTSPVPSTALIINTLKTFSVSLPTVQPRDPWAGKTIGIAILAKGLPGGYWDLDNVRLIEYPLSPDISGDSFVNLIDFNMMAAQWLSCGNPSSDLTGEGCVGIEDLIIMMDHWLDYV